MEYRETPYWQFAGGMWHEAADVSASYHHADGMILCDPDGDSNTVAEPGLQ